MIAQRFTRGLRHRPPHPLAPTAVLGIAVALTLAGCSSTSGSAAPTGPSSGPTTASTGPATASASATATASSPSPSGPSQSSGPSPVASGTVVALTEHDSGTTVTVPAGDTVRLVLHSTFWAPPKSSAPHGLEPVGTPTTASSTGPGCHPGMGCGTVTADFLARAAGTVQLTSTRSSCGEAMPCGGPAAANFTVTVVITTSR